MKALNQYLLTILTLFALSSNAQKAYLADPDNFDPEGEIKIMVDISKCDCQRLVGNPGPLYLWTWNPAELPASDPNSNGSWTSSNTNLEMTNEGGDIWSFTMVPTTFYKVEAGKVYERDFSFLVKALDGTGGGGGGCDEDKTEDLQILVDPPVEPAKIIAGFPSIAKPDDIVTIIYDNSIEEKETMQNLPDNATLFFMVELVLDDSTVVKPYQFFTIQNNPELKLTGRGDGTFRSTFVPEDHFANHIPTGRTLAALDVKFIVRERFLPENQSNASIYYTLGCPVE